MSHTNIEILEQTFSNVEGKLLRDHPAWREIKAQLAAVQPGVQPFQERAGLWLMECFGHDTAHDGIERNHRFLEESLELVQSLGCTASEAHQLVGYVFGRPVGEPRQELGGVMVTLAALCFAHGLDMQDGGEAELARISVPEIMAKVKAKQAAKPKHSPLPQHPTQQGLEQDAARYRWLRNESWACYNISKKKPEVALVACVRDGSGNVKTILAETAMDEAIDAALAAQAKQGS